MLDGAGLLTASDTDWTRRQAFSCWIAIILKWLHSGCLEDGVNLRPCQPGAGMMQPHNALRVDQVAAGRDYIKAYVIFTHYAEGLHALIKGGGGHHGEGAEGHGGHEQ